jgi:FtsP/CotA-like multicopper oxidase with cupredoxin domain
MKRRGFIKKSGLGAGSLFVGSSLVSFLASCTKMDMMNGGNMLGQTQPVTEGDFSRILPIPGTVTVNTTLNAQATTANMNGNTISVLGYQANGILGLLSPGERLDVLVNFTGLTLGTEVFLESKTFSNGGNIQGTQEFKILKFKITQTESDPFIIPAHLSSFDPINQSSSSKTRNFIINSMQMGGGMNMNMSGIHRINGKTYDRNRIDETISANSTEVWVFDNSHGNEAHPMHLHGVHFQVLERVGGRGQLIASEGGYKDTVLLLPGEIVKILVPFAELKGIFVFHCHNLEHEDDGMMLQYKLV